MTHATAKPWHGTAGRCGHASTLQHADLFTEFEPGCVVLHKHRRCIFVMFESFGAVVRPEDEHECTVVWADQIEFVSPPSAEDRAWALGRVPRKRTSWRDKGMGIYAWEGEDA